LSANSFATDTVYGVGVDASNFKAVEDLYKLKNRDKEKPIAIFVKDLAAAKKIFLFDELSEKIAKKFLPGSLTLVLQINHKSTYSLASNLNNNDDGFLGFRIIENNFIKNLLEKFNGIIAVTSANLSNEQPALSCMRQQGLVLLPQLFFLLGYDALLLIVRVLTLILLNPTYFIVPFLSIAECYSTKRAMIRRLQNDQNTHRNNIRQAGTVLAEYTRIQNDIDAARTQLANN
jgi:hypothetical protein